MFPVKVQSSDSESKNVKNTFHHAVAPFFIFSRFFGTMPVLGVWPTADVKQVHFKWFSLPVLVTVILIGFATMDVCLSLKITAEVGLKLKTTGPLSFSIECLTAFVVFLRLSSNWPQLIRVTREVENIFLRKPYSDCPESKKLSHSIRWLGGGFLVTALVEHSFYVSSSLYSNHMQIKECNLTVDFWKNYYTRERFQFFSLIRYNVFLVPLLQWITVSMTFVWNYVDIFVMLVSQALVMRFRQYNWCLQRFQKEQMSNDFWLQMRKDFLALTDLLSQYDKSLSALVILSCAQNLYFLASQIFHIFQYRQGFMTEMYFWTSMSFVAARTFSMMWMAAGIYDMSNDIMASIYEIPTSNWCLELKRLNEVIVSDLLALSGRGFFFLTKRLIFAMAGTLVIYELVLLDQIDGNDVVDALCNQRKG